MFTANRFRQINVSGVSPYAELPLLKKIGNPIVFPQDSWIANQPAHHNLSELKNDRIAPTAFDDSAVQRMSTHGRDGSPAFTSDREFEEWWDNDSDRMEAASWTRLFATQKDTEHEWQEAKLKLKDFLQSAFSGKELYRMLFLRLFGTEYTFDPNLNTSIDDWRDYGFHTTFLDHLDKYGLLNKSFFDLLKFKRPRWVQEIHQVEKFFSPFFSSQTNFSWTSPTALSDVLDYLVACDLSASRAEKIMTCAVGNEGCFAHMPYFTGVAPAQKWLIFLEIVVFNDGLNSHFWQALEENTYSGHRAEAVELARKYSSVKVAVPAQNQKYPPVQHGFPNHEEVVKGAKGLVEFAVTLCEAQQDCRVIAEQIRELILSRPFVNGFSRSRVSSIDSVKDLIENINLPHEDRRLFTYNVPGLLELVYFILSRDELRNLSNAVFTLQKIAEILPGSLAELSSSKR